MVESALLTGISYAIGLGSGVVSGILGFELFKQRQEERDKAPVRESAASPFTNPPSPALGSGSTLGLQNRLANRPLIVGIILILGGTIISILSFLFAQSVPLEAFGLACIILGFISSSLPVEMTASTSMKVLLRGGIQSSETILREAITFHKGVQLVRKEGLILNTEPPLEDERSPTSAVYLPPKEGLVGVFLPLGSNVSAEDIDAMWNAPRLVTEDGRGLLIFPIGAAIGEILNDAAEGFNLEECLQEILVDSAELCSRVTVSEVGTTITVGFKGVKIHADSSFYSSFLGSIPTSITGCVISSLKKRPTIVLDELVSQDRILARFRVV